MATEENIKVNGFKAWILASRPKTLSGAAVPVMIGSAWAYSLSAATWFNTAAMILCFLFAFIMQIDANLVNDYFDCVRGNDNPSERLGPKRACAEGWITLGAMRKGITVTTLLACAVGLPLVLYGGLWLILVGALCVAFCFLYTTKLSYLGLGDLLVLVFFGFVPVCFTCYVELPMDAGIAFSWPTVVLSLGCGLCIDTLLVVNNYRDMDNDRTDGKLTLVARLGRKRSEWLYLALGLLAVAASAVVAAHVGAPLWTFILWLPYLLLHVGTCGKLRRMRGRELNKVLGCNARNMFIYGCTSVVVYLCL